MNWHKPPLYPTSFNRNETGPTRGVASYSESSPPEEINDDVLPMCPVPTSTANQCSKLPIPQKSVQGRSIAHQPSKMTHKKLQSMANQMQNSVHQAGPATQIFDARIGVVPSNQPPSFLYNPQVVVGAGGAGGGNGAKIGKITADRRLGFTKLPTNELRAHVHEILHALNTFTLNQCHDKVHWFATVVLQQLLDLELYTACSTTVELCVHGQLKRTQRRLLLLSSEKRKLEQEKKQLTTQRTQLTKEKVELSKCKVQLEQSVKTLTPFEAKCQAMKMEEEKLKMDKQNMAKELEEVKKRSEQLNTKADQMERERDAYKLRMEEQATAMNRRVKELEEELAAAKNRPIATAADGTALDEHKFNELRQELKSKKKEVKKLLTDLDERTQQKQRWADMEEQLKRSEEKVDQHKHAAMELKLELRKRNEKIEKKRKQIMEALNAKRMAEDELSKVKAENALLKQQEQSVTTCNGVQRAVGAGETTAASNISGLFNHRLRSITKKRKEMDEAIALLCGEQKRVKSSSFVEKEVPLSSSSTVPPTINAIGRQQDFVSEQFSPSPLPRTTTKKKLPIVVTIEKHKQQQQQQSPVLVSNHTTKAAVVVSEQEHQQQNEAAPTQSVSHIIVNVDQSQKQQSAASIASVAGSHVDIVEQQQHCLAQSSATAHSLPSSPSSVATTSFTVSSMNDSSAKTTTQANDEQQQQRQSNADSVIEEDNGCASQASVGASAAPPAQESNQPQPQQLSAAQIVNSFVRYIYQHPGQDGRCLVQTYLQQSTIPAQFQPLIAEKLNLIVATARTKNVTG